MTSQALIAALLSAAVLVVAGCGGDGSPTAASEIGAGSSTTTSAPDGSSGGTSAPDGSSANAVPCLISADEASDLFGVALQQRSTGGDADRACTIDASGESPGLTIVKGKDDLATARADYESGAGGAVKVIDRPDLGEDAFVVVDPSLRGRAFFFESSSGQVYGVLIDLGFASAPALVESEPDDLMEKVVALVASRAG